MKTENILNTGIVREVKGRKVKTEQVIKKENMHSDSVHLVFMLIKSHPRILQLYLLNNQTFQIFKVFIQ